MNIPTLNTYLHNEKQAEIRLWDINPGMGRMLNTVNQNTHSK